MSKITLNNVQSLTNQTAALATINGNYATLVNSFDNTLSRDGTTPNQMLSNLDLNNYHILNLPEPSSDTDPIRKIDLTNVSQVTNVIHTASSTSITIGLGARTFTVPSGLGFFPGQYLLIQNSLDTTKYMLGRVTSYTGATLVMNILNTAGTGTYSTWSIDISGPIGLSAVIYDTVSNAISATIDPTITFLNLVGYYTIGDGGNGQYQRTVSQPSDSGKFQSVDGSWWHLVSTVISPEMFGCKGDGTTNDQVNFQNCLNSASSRMVRLTAGKNYRIVLNSGVTDLGLIIPNNTVLDTSGATISMECNGYVYGMRLLNNLRITGNGTIATTVSTGLTNGFGLDQSIWHAPISLGTAYGSMGTVASKSIYGEVHDWIIEQVTITSVRNNGQGTLIGGLGGMYHGVIRNCIFPDNATTSVAIGFDWGFYGTVDSTNGATLTTTAASYNAGTAYTVHPHQIVIENNYIGNMTMPVYTSGGSPFGSHGVRLSGCYDIKVANNDVEQTTYASIFVTGGDVGFDFALTAIRNNALKNIQIKDNNLKNVNLYYGVYWDAFPDNIYAAVNLSTYSPFYDYLGYYNNSTITGNKISGTSGTSIKPGIQVIFTRGTEVSNNYVQTCNTGILVGAGCNNVSVTKNTLFFNNQPGIYVSDDSATLLPFGCKIRDNWSKRNCTSGAAIGNIYIGYANQTIVDGNYIGAYDEDQSLAGLYVNSVAIYTTVTNNEVYEVKTTGVAYKFLETAGIGSIWVFRDNRYSGGANTYLNGSSIMPVRREYSVAVPGVLVTHAEAQRASMGGDVTPSFGTWGQGSTVYNVDSTTTGQVSMSKCTVTGTPGTWKSTSIIP